MYHREQKTFNNDGIEYKRKIRSTREKNALERNV